MSPQLQFNLVYMLNDPLSFLAGGTLPVLTGGVATTMVRTGVTNGFTTYNGINAPYSSDQPARVWIKSTQRVGSKSTSDIQYQQDRNVAAIAGVPQKDTTYKVRVIIESDHQHFTTADTTSIFNSVVDILRQNLVRIHHGGES